MKNRLPRPRELAILVALSVVCTLIVALTGKYDVGLAIFAGPLFLVAALMGLRRNMANAAAKAAAQVDSTPAQATDAASA
jgi:hypothetical protein